MKIKKAFTITLLAGLLNTAANAQTERLDDSASPLSTVEARSITSESGMPLSESPGAQLAISDFGLVKYRLATAAYKGQSAKIYYVIPTVIEGLQSAHALTVTWKGNGLFADGEGHAGDRQLVWSGTVTEDWMEEEFNLRQQVELEQLRLPAGKGFGFESYFEIETLP
jgi:hypothetical protein